MTITFARSSAETYPRWVYRRHRAPKALVSRGIGGNVNEDQVEGKVKQGEGKLQELLGDAKEKVSDLKGKAEDALEDVKETFEEAQEEREAVRRSEDEAARHETDPPPGPGASVITP
ncbi:MAG: hypothetical protein LH654_15220 [Thermoleophilia bacterium]|nr:hypothetical protein [Thermoleophilia bacterium]